MSADVNNQREERLNIINCWSEVGVQKDRVKLPIETDFRERVNNADVFFKPIRIEDIGSAEGDEDWVAFHRQVSYLIDAFDLCPYRVDLAFDSVWRAFEQSISEKEKMETVTDNLLHLAKDDDLDHTLVAGLCKNIPMQSCEYLFKRLMPPGDNETDKRGEGVRNRIRNLNNQEINQLVDFLHTNYPNNTDTERRNGAVFLRKVLRKEQLEHGQLKNFELSDVARAHVLLSLFLYTARNERVHGDSFSPFLSSTASIKTYTHPYYAFLSTYYLLMSIWTKIFPNTISSNSEELLDSLNNNLTLAKKVFGTRHWDK